MKPSGPVSPWWRDIPADRWKGGRSHQRRKRKDTEKKKEKKKKNNATQPSQEEEHFRERLENLRQRTLTGNDSHHPSDSWGDRMVEKRDDFARICLLNISGFSLSAHSAKDDHLQSFMEENDVDVMILPEANVCWHKLHHRDRLHERTFGWFEDIHRGHAYNFGDDESDRRQYGGIVILSRNHSASRVMESGRDETGLGRWTWVRYRGRNGIIT